MCRLIASVAAEPMTALGMFGDTAVSRLQLLSAVHCDGRGAAYGDGDGAHEVTRRASPAHADEEFVAFIHNARTRACDPLRMRADGQQFGGIVLARCERLACMPFWVAVGGPERRQAAVGGTCGGPELVSCLLSLGENVFKIDGHKTAIVYDERAVDHGVCDVSAARVIDESRNRVVHRSEVGLVGVGEDEVGAFPHL